MWRLQIAAKARKALFLQLLELSWRRSCFEERARRRCGIVLLVAVHAYDIVVRAFGVLALGRVHAMVRREVSTPALTAPGFPGAADRGGVTPLEASGALTGSRSDGPGLASPSYANKRDRRFK